MDMIIFAYIWFAFLLLTTLFILVAGIIEKNFDEKHPIKKWWRKNFIGIAPKDIDI